MVIGHYFVRMKHLDYMIVGDDDSSTIDDKPRPKGRRLSLFLRSVFLKIFAKKVFEWGSWWKLWQLWCTLLRLSRAGSRDINHGRQKFLREVGEAIWRRTGSCRPSQKAQQRGSRYKTEGCPAPLAFPNLAARCQWLFLLLKSVIHFAIPYANK